MNGRNIVIVKLAGGLGNQMFQYATGRRLAYIHNVPVKLDLSGYGPEGDTQAPGLEAFRRQVKLLEFNIAATKATPDEITALSDRYFGSSTRNRLVRQLRRILPGLWWPATHIVEQQYRFDPKILNLTVPCYMGGLWQSEKYFADIREIICREFVPRDPAITNYVRQYVAALRGGVKAVVSVHVRRGELAYAQDVLKNTQGVFGPPTGTEYIRQAMRQFAPDCKFLVFSDTAKDIAWCKENIKADCLHFSEGHTDIQDMMLMSACDHHIVASTFSWWAAWLNSNPGKKVVAPSQWGFQNVKFKMVPDDLVPAEWQII